MHYTSRDVARPAEVLPWLRDLPEDLTPWLDEVGLPDGLPFLLSPRYEYDMVLNSYFHRVSLIDAPWNSNANRARALAAFLNFLHRARGGKSWRQATEGDHLAFHQWRRRDPAGPRVAGGTWSQEVSHVNQFYEWAVRQNQIGAVPIPQRSRRPAPPGTLRPPGARARSRRLTRMTRAASASSGCHRPPTGSGGTWDCAATGLTACPRPGSGAAGRRGTRRSPT